jgi:hypothetical protein
VAQTVSATTLAFTEALADVINLGNSLRQHPQLADAYDDEAIGVIQNGNEIHVDIGDGGQQFIVTVTEAVPTS